jgi:hypothetical protein
MIALQSMPAGIHINQTSFGKLSGEADTLVLELSEYSISFCELNNSLNQPLYILHHDFEANSPLSVKEQLISAIKHFRFSQKNYQTVYVNFFTELFTLCPAAFYDPENSRQLLEFNAGKTGDAVILNDDISPEIKLIYAIDEHLKSTLDLLFPHHHIKHTVSVLSQLMLHSEEFNKEQVVLNVHQNHIELVIKENTKLLLANQFSVKTQEDILYYVLFALEQYQLNPASVTLCITGNTDHHSDLVSTIKKYVKHTRLAIGHRSINWQSIEGMPQHFNYSLINRPFCES